MYFVNVLRYDFPGPILIIFDFLRSTYFNTVRASFVKSYLVKSILAKFLKVFGKFVDD